MALYPSAPGCLASLRFGCHLCPPGDKERLAVKAKAYIYTSIPTLVRNPLVQAYSPPGTVRLGSIISS